MALPLGTFVGLRKVQLSRQAAADRLAELERQAELEEEKYQRRLRDQTIARREGILTTVAAKAQKAMGDYRSSKDYTEAIGAVEILEKRLKEVNLTDKEETYFKNLKTDPFAVKETLEFVNKLEQKLNTEINIKDIPLIQGIVTSPTPMPEKIDFMSKIFGEDVDLTDDKTFFNILTEFQDSSRMPGRTVFTYNQPGVFKDPKKQLALDEDQFTLVASVLVAKASQFLRDRKFAPGDEEVVEVQKLKNKLGKTGDTPADKAIRQDAFNKLFVKLYSPVELQDLINTFPNQLRGFGENPIVSILYDLYDKYTPLSGNSAEVQKDVDAAIAALKADPSTFAKTQFDLTFGQGKAEEVLLQTDEIRFP